jgi:hypothetical protein
MTENKKCDCSGLMSIPLSAMTAVLIYIFIRFLFFPTPKPEVKTELRVYEYHEETRIENGVEYLYDSKTKEWVKYDVGTGKR